MHRDGTLAASWLPWATVAVLSAWLGASLVFSAVVAPAAFAVLPTRTLAGALVGRVLPVLFLSGIVVGGLVLAGELAWRRGAAPSWMLRGAVGAVVVACAIAQLAIGARIARLRETIGGPLEALAPGDPRRLEFGRLHGVSVALLGAALLAAFAAVVLIVLRERPRTVEPGGATERTIPVTSSR